MFTSYPTYNPYRTLQALSPMQHGEDVYALQTALNECGFDCGEADGILGGKTALAIKAAQKKYYLTVDGKAGGRTQEALALDIAQNVAHTLVVPLSALRGQLELESGFRLGNYSPLRPDNSYDAGVAQRNTHFAPPSSGFDASASIEILGSVVRKHYVLFDGLFPHRRWALAQGAWNAPAFACYIAREEGATKVAQSMTMRPTPLQRETFEEYVKNVTAYLAV